MTNLRCLLGFHSWDGCVCKRCEKIRDEQHDIDGCKCRSCETLNPDVAHEFDGCRCVKCGTARDEQHDFDGCKCRKCGQVRDEGHHYVTEVRRNCAHPNRGIGQHNDPCYGASCSDCEETVCVCTCCGKEKISCENVINAITEYLTM